MEFDQVFGFAWKFLFAVGSAFAVGWLMPYIPNPALRLLFSAGSAVGTAALLCYCEGLFTRR